MMRNASFTLSAFTLLLAGCSNLAVIPITIPLPIAAADSDAALQSFAKQLLNDLQSASITQAREYCGYIYVDASGRLASTPAQFGTLDTCDYGFAPETTLASFHTHANFSPEYDSEVPSLDDVQASIDTGIIDFLATPGGRFWLIGDDGVSQQLCVPGCMIADPAFVPDPSTPVDTTYTIGQLRLLLS